MPVFSLPCEIGAGQPPAQMSVAYSSTLVLDTPSTSFCLLKSELRLTSPVETFDSSSDIGSMSRRVILPVPVCFGFSSSSKFGSVVDPVKRNCPFAPPRVSISLITASHKTGATCHSSMSLGRVPRKRREGRREAASMLLA